MNEIQENVVTHAVENVTHAVSQSEVTETAVNAAKSLTLGGIGIGIVASAAIGGLVYGGSKLYKLISRKVKEAKERKNMVNAIDGEVIDGECSEVK